MEFKQLEAFVNVVKYKSFSKAAEYTFLTQPTISTHISQLEKELGVILIDRHAKESRPTKQGRAFYNYAVNILNTRERAINQMNDFGTEISGTLDIRTSTLPGEYILPNIISKFSKVYPNVKFEITENDSEKVNMDIVENLGDIGFTGTLSDNGLKYESILKDKFVLITPKNEKYLNLKRVRDKVRIMDFKDEKFILREEGSATRTLLENAILKAYGNLKLNTVATVNNIEAVKKYVSMGLGLSVLSKVSVSEDADYISFDIEDLICDREFYMVYNKNTTLSPLALEFKKFVMEG